MKINYWKLGIWLVLFAGAVYVEFGVVFVILSVLYFMVASLRSHGNVNSQGEKMKSAYSVFNKGFEKIQGTYDGEKLDKELRRGFM